MSTDGLDDAALAELLGVPWEALTEQHREMVRELVGDSDPAWRAKAVHWAVHLLTYQGRYVGACGGRCGRREARCRAE